jgi:hypothetical protein
VIADGGTRRDGSDRDGRWWHPARWRQPQQSNGGAPSRWSQSACLPGRCGSRTVVRKDRANAAEELGDEDGGVALRLGTVDPLQRCGANLRKRGQE